MSGRAPISLAVALIAAAAAAAAQVPPPREPTQSTLPPTPAVAFPPAVSVLIGFGSFGTRATSVDTPLNREHSHALTNGPTAAGRLQSPLGRRFGLNIGGAVAYRNYRESIDGSPLSASSQRLLSLRGEAGLLFRFKPAAPVFFGGSFVYQHHSRPAVEQQAGGPTTELGGGFGIGYEFGKKPGSNLSGRVEFWNYFMGPNAEGLPDDFTSRSTARDMVFVVGITQRLRLPSRRAP